MTSPDFRPLVTLEELAADRQDFERRARERAKKTTPEHLIERIGKNRDALRLLFSKSVAKVIEIGNDLETLYQCTPYGGYMDAVAELGIKRQSSQNYRDLAAHAHRLKAEPGFAEMTPSECYILIATWKKALKNGEDLDGERPGEGGQPKLPRTRGHGSHQPDPLERLFRQIDRHVQENGHADPETVAYKLRIGDARIRVMIEELERKRVVDLEPNDATLEDPTPAPAASPEPEGVASLDQRAAAFARRQRTRAKKGRDE